MGSKAEVEMLAVDCLSGADAKILKVEVTEQLCYGAIAVDATVAAANHLTTEAASAAALAGCEAKRKGRRPCEIAGLIRPAGWTDRGLSLSPVAKKGFREDFGTRGSRALAVSAATGRWGLGEGGTAAEAAIRACAAPGGAQDCALAVAD